MLGIKLKIVTFFVLIAVTAGLLLYSNSSPGLTDENDTTVISNENVTVAPKITQKPQSTINPNNTPISTSSESTVFMESPHLSSNEIDASWISIVDQYLNDSMPYPDWKIDYTLNAYSISLFDNGTRTFIGASNGNDFSAYLLSIISKANKQLNSSISDSYVERITQCDKVLAFRIRLGTMFSQGGFHAWDFYFVLDDTLNQELNGLIFVEHDIDNTSMWQSWAITK
jgi:hypothetical protein